MITQEELHNKAYAWWWNQIDPLTRMDAYKAGYQQALNDLKEQGMAILEEGERKVQELLQDDGAYRHMHWVREHPEYVTEPTEDKRDPAVTC